MAITATMGVTYIGNRSAIPVSNALCNATISATQCTLRIRVLKAMIREKTAQIVRSSKTTGSIAGKNVVDPAAQPDSPANR